MVTEFQVKGALLDMISRLANDMPADVEDQFWAQVIDPIASLVVRLRGELTEVERMFLIAIAARAVRAAADEQAAHDDAMAAIRRAGGAA